MNGNLFGGLAQGFQQGMQMTRQIQEGNRKRRLRDAYAEVLPALTGSNIAPEDAEESFGGSLPDIEEMIESGIKAEYGEDAEFVGFESGEDGAESAVRYRVGDGEPQLVRLNGRAGRDLLTLPNDADTGTPNAEALRTIASEDPQGFIELQNTVRERRRQRQARELQATSLERAAGLSEPSNVTVDDLVNTPDRFAIDRGSVGQDGAPSLEAAQNMPRNRRTGARTSPAEPMPPAPEGESLESAASRAPAAPPPSARRGEAPAPNGELDENQAAFVQSIWSDAERTARELGVPTEAVVAQAALETGWGQSAPGNNLFGIKGEGQRLPTEEVVNGERRNTEASFRTYDSRAGAFQDLQSVLNNERYADARGAQTPGEYGAALQAGGYATDPEYGAKIKSVADTIRSGMSLPDGGRGRNPRGLNAIATPSYEQDIPTNPSAPTSLGSVVGDTGYRLGQGLNRVIGAGRATVDDLTDVVGSVGDTLAEGVEGFQEGAAGQQRSSEPSGGQTGSSGGQSRPQPEQSGESRQAQTSTGRFTINAGDAQGGNERANFELPSQRQVDRTRARAQRQIRAGEASNEFSRDVIDGVRNGIVSYEQGQEMLGLGSKEYFKPVQAEDGGWVMFAKDGSGMKRFGTDGGVQDEGSNDFVERMTNVADAFGWPDEDPRRQNIVSALSQLQSTGEFGTDTEALPRVMDLMESNVRQMQDQGLFDFSGVDSDSVNASHYVDAYRAANLGLDAREYREDFKQTLANNVEGTGVSPDAVSQKMVRVVQQALRSNSGASREAILKDARGALSNPRTIQEFMRADEATLIKTLTDN